MENLRQNRHLPVVFLSLATLWITYQHIGSVRRRLMNQSWAGSARLSQMFRELCLKAGGHHGLAVDGGPSTGRVRSLPAALPQIQYHVCPHVTSRVSLG